jgi:two-component system chemotaxis response regulator CheB
VVKKVKKIKVAIVDDSAFMRKVIRDSLQERGFEIVAIGRNGKDAIAIASKRVADVMTLDVQMPVIDGMEALKEIMKKFPMPVIMVSSLTKKDAKITLEALALGAFDFVTKPGGAISLNFNEIADELAEKVILASSSFKNSPQPLVKEETYPKKEKISFGEKKSYDMVIIGSSTGGPKALDAIIPNIPSNFPLPILLIQHMPPKFTTALAKRLDESSHLRVVEVTEKMEIKAGTVYVATGEKHMDVLKGTSYSVAPVDGPKLNSVRPAVDYTLNAAANKGATVLCVILTGMGKDGTDGLKKFEKDKVTVIAESERTATVYGMPKSVVNAGLADYVLDVNEISSKMMSLVR